MCSSSVSYTSVEDNKRSFVLIQSLCPTSRLHFSNRVNVSAFLAITGRWLGKKMLSVREDMISSVGKTYYEVLAIR